MTKNLLRFFSGIIIFIYLAVLCVPALASAGTEYKQTTNLFHWWKDAPFWGDLIGYTTGFVCTESEDGYHHSSTFDHKSWLSEGDRYRCTCDYCGREFTAYESDLKKTYTKQVSENNYPIINSAGAYSWKILPDKLYLIDGGFASGASLTVGSDRISFSGVMNNLSKSECRILFCLTEPFYAPVDGIYSLSLCTIASRNIDIPDWSFAFTQPKGFYAGDICLKAYGGISSSSNPVFSMFLDDVISAHKELNYSSFPVSFEGYVVLSCVPGISSNPIYNIKSRPTSITGGNYGIIGDGGTINTITNNKPIINEITNIFYNPATGQEYPIGGWSYNYENRTYNITLDTGDTVNVEYGDENINITETTIIEGDTIVNNYTIYYMIDGTGGDSPNPSPAPTPCVHSWQESARTDAACTAPGRVTYTCSQCGETKSETLPALGHDWKTVRTVPTEYDENGVQIQEGYTLYECQRCGEQYKDADSTGPPDGSVNDGGLIEWLNGLIKSLSDNLSGAVELILSFFTEIPKLFGGFLDFISAIFPFLPDEIMLLLTFGIAALVFVGIIKAIRR